jgi:endoglucanase
MNRTMWRVLAKGGVLAPIFIYGCGEFGVDNSQTSIANDAGTDVGTTALTTDLDAAIVDLSDVGPVGPAMTGLRVQGNQIVNAQGQPVALHGVNRSGTEYECVAKGGVQIFDGLSNEASVQAIASWKANAVRIPLNESCWLGNSALSPAVSGAAYQQAIGAYVALLHKYGIVPIIDLHWVGPNGALATAQQPMPDDNSVNLWTSVAQYFANDDGVLFEPYNEPFPGNDRDTTAAWTCWLNGCSSTQAGLPRDAGTVMYDAVGMQALVNAIRAGENGATPHVILLGGIEYSNDLSAWAANEPTDPANNLGAAWHIYSFNACNSPTCYDADGGPATLALSVPILATEIGERDCESTFIDGLMPWLEDAGVGYLAWSWDVYGACAPQPPPEGGAAGGSPYSLVTNYLSGMPNSDYARSFQKRLATFSP